MSPPPSGALSPVVTHLERVPSTLPLQHVRLEDLPNESFGVVDGALRVAVGHVRGFVSHQHGLAGESHRAGDAQSAVLVRDHLHLPAARVEDAHGAESGAQVQADHPGFGGRQVLLAQVAGQEQSQDDGT